MSTLSETELIREPPGLGDFVYAYAHAKSYFRAHHQLSLEGINMVTLVSAKRHALEQLKELNGGASYDQDTITEIESRISGWLRVSHKRDEQRALKPSIDGVTGDLTRKASRLGREAFRDVRMAVRALRDNDTVYIRTFGFSYNLTTDRTSRGHVDYSMVTLCSWWRKLVYKRGIAVVEGELIHWCAKSATRINRVAECYEARWVTAHEDRFKARKGIVFRVGSRWYKEPIAKIIDKRRPYEKPSWDQERRAKSRLRKKIQARVKKIRREGRHV